MAEKPSVSGLMNQSHEINRFENLFFKQLGTAYYNQSWGLDWRLWLDTKYELSLGSFFSYVTQEAMKKGIVVTNIDGGIKEFTLQTKVKIEGLSFDISRGIA